MFSRQAITVTSKIHNILVPTTVRCMSTNKLVDLQVNDKTGIATLSMQKPPVNSLNLEMLQALLKSFDEITSNRCKGMILTSVCDLIL